MRFSAFASLALVLTAAAASPLSNLPHDDRSFSVRQTGSLPNHQLRVKSPKFCAKNVTQYSGYLDTAEDKHFFFWFFEARNKPSDGTDTPLILWLNGGPGASSLVGALMEQGPCRIARGGNSTIDNPYAWNDRAHIMFLDQPTNAGFSYGSGVSTSTAAGTDIAALLQLFYVSFPQYAKSPLHVFGESYAGHYIPAAAAAIVEANKNVTLAKSSNSNSTKQDLPILPLTSIGIGNGMVNPATQFKYYAKMACNSTYPPVLSKAVCKSMESNYPMCKQLLDDCYGPNGTDAICTQAQLFCQVTQIEMFTSFDKNNPYDVRGKCVDPHCSPYTVDTTNFLNLPRIQKEFGAKEMKFKLSSPDMADAFIQSRDYMRSYSEFIPALLDKAGVRVLVYAGDADFACNWYGTKAWVQEMEWSGKKGFHDAKNVQWVVGNKPAGEVRAFGKLAFARVFESGHMVPTDQPVNALDMVNRWLSNKPFSSN
ncbi:peptidase S10, serine carboxypeptidase [Martensiomyces pterosporus]|nr:peptidase S10, serine carboxypeptidase [Martensiomyces pterosporus]